MSDFIRSTKNPLLKPNPVNPWEKMAAFNPSIVEENGVYHLVYRALSEKQEYKGHQLSVSTVGYTTSIDKEHFQETKQLIVPSESWDTFGCEDPRITKIDDDYFIFYTALSEYPFRPQGIKVGLALFSDLTKPSQKHLVTPFNAKAMTLFPKKIQGKYVALLTVNTDIPPSYIAIARFDRKEDIWSQVYWNKWYQNFQSQILPLARLDSDQLEVGSVPILTSKGWLVIYSHIQHYYEEDQRIFGVEAVLLDKNNPSTILARTDEPLLTPEADYEKHGMVPNVVFPSGGIGEKNIFSLFYGASDTYSCLATCDFSVLLQKMLYNSPVALKVERPLLQPLLTPEPSHLWEQKAVFNPGVFEDNSTIYLIYRAMNEENTSVFGLATSSDGLSIQTRSEMPIYVPRAQFEMKKASHGNSGCEDPRITKIGNTLFMCYTAYDGMNPPRVALTSMKITDFRKGSFNWQEPILISPPGIDDKDAALFPEKINGKYVFIHRIQNAIVFDHVDDLHFTDQKVLRSLAYISPCGNSWDSEKIGLCTPPIKTTYGWLIFYHGVSKWSHKYRVGAMLLDLKRPDKVVSRTPWPILEPLTTFEKEGYVNNVVFPCGCVIKDGTVFIYYGGADKVVGVVTISLYKLINYLLCYRVT